MISLIFIRGANSLIKVEICEILIIIQSVIKKNLQQTLQVFSIKKSQL